MTLQPAMPMDAAPTRSGHAGLQLLRHGDTGQRGFRGRIDDALTPHGWQQMRVAMAGSEWDMIVTSPLRRCADFAAELAARCGARLREDARLAEYDFGQWQALSLETLADQHGDALARFWADPVAHPPPDAESFAAFQARLVAALDAIAVEQHDGGASPRILVITHGGVIRLLRCLVDGRPLRDMSLIDVPHASVHGIEWPVAGPRAGEGH